MGHFSRAPRIFESDQKPELAEPVLQAFLAMKPEIVKLVDETFGTVLSRFRGALDQGEIRLVKNYLSRGVVPSTLIQRRKGVFPNPVTLINAAYLFYLENLPELMGRIKGQRPRILSERNKWSERVESWTLKALEDIRLALGHPEPSNGSAIEQGSPTAPEAQY